METALTLRVQLSRVQLIEAHRQGRVRRQMMASSESAPTLGWPSESALAGQTARCTGWRGPKSSTESVADQKWR